MGRERNLLMVLGFVAGAAIAALVAVLVIDRPAVASERARADEPVARASLAHIPIEDRIRLSESEGRLSVQRVSEEGRLRVQTETERGRMELLATYLREKPTVLQVGGRELIYLPTLVLDAEKSRLEQRFYRLGDDDTIRAVRIERFSSASESVRPAKAAAPKTILPDATTDDATTDDASRTEPVKQSASPNESSDDTKRADTKRDEAKKIDSEG